MGEDEAALTHHQTSPHFVKICQDHNPTLASVVCSLKCDNQGVRLAARLDAGPAAPELLQRPEPKT